MIEYQGTKKILIDSYGGQIMARRPPKSIPIPAKRLRKLLEDNSLTQKELAKRLYIDARYVSMLACGRRGMSKEMASHIVACFPGTRAPWLLGLDDYMTDADLYLSVFEKTIRKTDLVDDLITELGYKVEHGFQDIHTEPDGAMIKSGPRVTITSPDGAIRYLPEYDSPEGYSLYTKHFTNS